MAILAMHEIRQPAPVDVDEQFARSAMEDLRQLRAQEEQLRAQEKNLREYEARLRSLQTQIDASRGLAFSLHQAGAGTTPVPVPADEITIEASWQKLQRTYEIFELEQRTLLEERQALLQLEADLKLKLKAIEAREAEAAEREAKLAAMPEAKTP
jgi:hypothetical protein